MFPVFSEKAKQLVIEKSNNSCSEKRGKSNQQQQTEKLVVHVHTTVTK
jgi:hypothetical protein